MNLIRPFLITLFTCVFALNVFSQTSPPTKLKLDENSIVVDSAGTRYAYSIWRYLVGSGDYSLKAVRNGQEYHYLLYKLSEEMKVKRMESIAKPRESPYFNTGSRLKDFSLKDLNGKKYKLKELSGKVVVLNFWFINCGPCRKEIPDLNKLVVKYKDSTDVVFLAIALDDARSIETFLKQSPFNYNIVSDGRYDAEMYGIKSYPTHVVLDRRSNVIFHTNGLGINTVHWIDKSIAEGLTSKLL